ncbi:MAG: thioredoxin domain-containing protein [Actinomycetota bacterium]
MPNRLANATSPYLLQHAHNPVDWFPWGPEALAKAKAEDKPLLLSIGYAACHWCHVMERESFEDESTAAVMNASFVCIKVDREERPDLDAIYMDAVQAMTGRGGWPMTMFCTPDGTPFYGGTYFPPEDRSGMPSFKRLLASITDAWSTQRDGVLQQGQKLVETIGQLSRMAAPDRSSDRSLSRATIDDAFASMVAQFDGTWGGFGGAPKFPQPMTLEFLLRMTRIDRHRDSATHMLTTTLDRMARGGIYDHVGGGFARYSVDGRWHVPHFEKMLYDNAQLLRLYAHASAVLPDRGYGTVAIHTAEYLLREMRHAGGGFYSSQDADSEGVEGKFYVWSIDELRSVLGDDADLAIALYGVRDEGNWEGTNVLWLPRPVSEVSSDDLGDAIARIRAALFQKRQTRIRPGTDDKILASWNGMAISALAITGRMLNRPDFVDAARTAAMFVSSSMQDNNGRLQRSWRDNRTSGPAFLDDYALFATGLLDLYETTFQETLFASAQKHADEMLTLFSDPNGGFFDTGSDQETLIVRPKDLYDNAVPSGSSAAAQLLVRLAALTGEARYQDAAEATLRIVQPVLARAPLGFGAALSALDDITAPIKEIAISGDTNDSRAQQMLSTVWSTPAIPHVLAAGRSDQSIVPLLKDRPASQPTAYVCKQFTCSLPVTDVSALRALLDDESA